MLTPANVTGSGPRILRPLTTPCTPLAKPEPWMVTISPGATQPGFSQPGWSLKKVPFKNTMPCGPIWPADNVNVVEKVPDVATMVIFPAVEPAVTAVEAAPVASVVVVGVATTALPLVTANVTGAPGTPLPKASTTLTINGAGKAVPTKVD